MRATGIVAEFNPFHQGHAYLVRKVREELGSDVVVSVMSGDFCQRGEPCIEDKWTRAEAAVRGGVDLVVELPTVYATASAELFAQGAVDILEGFGGIDRIAFGSESGDLAALLAARDFLGEHEEKVNRRAAELLRSGLSYPRAREEALSECAEGFDVSLISQPNNILALEYLRQIETMQPYTVARDGSGYHETATRIRQEMQTRDPEGFALREQKLFDLLRYQVVRCQESDLDRISGGEGGLANRLASKIRYASNREELIELVKSKAYTRTRITRMMIHTLLGIDQEAVEEARPYIRVLAFNRTGSRFLKECIKREVVTVPVISNVNKDSKKFSDLKSTLRVDRRAFDVYNILTARDMYQDSDFLRMPVFVDSETNL